MKHIVQPLFIQAGDPKVLINGSPVKADCRLVPEENYQAMKRIYDIHNEVLTENKVVAKSKKDTLKEWVYAAAVVLFLLGMSIASFTLFLN